jgi:hypothetical protein
MHDCRDHHPREDELALKLWCEREMTFPAFVRRMTWDQLDHASGAVDQIRCEALKLLNDRTEDRRART